VGGKQNGDDSTEDVVLAKVAGIKVKTERLAGDDDGNDGRLKPRKICRNSI